MIKTVLVLSVTTAIASAWFMPSISFGGSVDSTNIDKNFTRDNKQEIVIDEKAAKAYYDSTPSKEMHFYAAWDYCQKMDYLGHYDWRVPTKRELISLFELSRRDVSVKHAFKNIQKARYWSATEDRYGKAWYFDFDLGRYSTERYSKKYKTICVRNYK